MKITDVKEGNVYRVIDWRDKGETRPTHWNTRGEMDKWCGKAVTISAIKYTRIRILEDKSKWLWSYTDLEYIYEAWDSPKGGPTNPNKAFRALKRG